MASKKRTSRSDRRSSRRSREPGDKRWIVQTAGGHILSQHDKRLDAEMWAARKSKNGGWLEVRDRKSPLVWTDEQRRQMPVLGKTSLEWVSIYRSGWLKDSNRRGSYVPPDQKKYHASLP
jgi:hypothetical protein